MKTVATMAFSCFALGMALSSPARAELPSGNSSALKIGRCVNLTPSLHDVLENFDDIRLSISNAGFKTVRIPIRINRNLDSSRPFVVNDDYLNQARILASRFSRSGISVILDAHDFSSFKSDPERNRGDLLAFWTQALAKWGDLPTNVHFELLNEPAKGINSKNLEKILRPSFLLLRSKNPNRNLIVGGSSFSHYKALPQTAPFIGPRVMPTFHYYDPMNFTHQSASWTEKYRDTGRVGLPEDYKQRIDLAVSYVSNFKKAYRTNVFVGETGTTKYADPNDRIRYLNYVVSSFEKIGVDSCLWDWPLLTDAFEVKSISNSIYRN